MNFILATNPTLLAHWKTVSHVQRPPQRTPQPDDGGSASGSESGTGGTGSTSSTGS